MISTAHPTPSSAALISPATSSLELMEARQARDGLATLLRAERAAAADFLLALSAFDRRRGWETLGYASLFAFLNVELGLSKGGAFFRQTAARLLQRFPDLVEPLRDGRLCITTVVELSKVLTESNRAQVVPRFYCCSSQEAKEVVAELVPVVAPPVRAVVTAVASPRAVVSVQTVGEPAPVSTSAPMPPTLPTDELVQSTEPGMTHPARVVAHRDEVEPLTADLRRLHVTVTLQFLKKLGAARDGLSHSIPGASAEQVLEAALDLLLEKQAKARGLVKRPRTVVAAAVPAVANVAAKTADSPAGAMGSPGIDRPPDDTGRSSETDDFGTEPFHRRTGPREAIPAYVRRAVWVRDLGRCSWPLDSGGVCGSTHRLELDHIHPWARDGEPTAANLRVVCHAHNALAARRAFGHRCVDRYARQAAT
jgi:hypothetical protein